MKFPAGCPATGKENRQCSQKFPENQKNIRKNDEFLWITNPQNSQINTDKPYVAICKPHSFFCHSAGFTPHGTREDMGHHPRTISLRERRSQTFHLTVPTCKMKITRIPNSSEKTTMTGKNRKRISRQITSFKCIKPVPSGPHKAIHK